MEEMRGKHPRQRLAPLSYTMPTLMAAWRKR
jgi:hypothetical protein